MKNRTSALASKGALPSKYSLSAGCSRIGAGLSAVWNIPVDNLRNPLFQQIERQDVPAVAF
jgi:hypothetical protein